MIYINYIPNRTPLEDKKGSQTGSYTYKNFLHTPIHTFNQPPNTATHPIYSFIQAIACIFFGIHSGINQD